MAAETTMADLLAAVAALRLHVAAVDCPDEGMRGTAADAPKLAAAADPATCHTLAAALTAAAGDPSPAGEELCEVASATIRSISVTPEAAAAVASAVAAGCCAALRQGRGLRWLLAALVRLAQHVECHPALLAAGAVPATVVAWAASTGSAEEAGGLLELGAFGSGAEGAPRLDLVACILLSFLGESSGPAVDLVPTEAIAPFVAALAGRLALSPGPAEASLQVSSGLFFGLPLYFRPRFIVQALANLCSRSDAHCAAAWHTDLPPILTGLRDGSFPNDTDDNVPYGSPDAVEVARGLAASLLAYHNSSAGATDAATTAAAPSSLAGIIGLAHGPTNGCPGWTFHGMHGGVTFRGCSAVNDSVAWVSGSLGTVLRTTNAGETWDDASPGISNCNGTGNMDGEGEGEGDLQYDFRDVVALDAENAYILSIGFGDASRIMRTRNGGGDWETLFVNDEADAFYNCIEFWPDTQHGIAYSDTVDGQFRIITTEDGGVSWSVVPADSLPVALDGEGAFAASGKNIVVAEGGACWIGMGAAASARVLYSYDHGVTWLVAMTPIDSGPSAGIFSLTFLDDCLHGVAVGGDFAQENQAGKCVAVTADGGVSWELVPESVNVGGFRSAVQFVELLDAAGNGNATTVLLAVGPAGADLSLTNGRSWEPVSTPWRGLHTFSQAGGGRRGFSAGGGGGVASVELAAVLGAQGARL